MSFKKQRKLYRLIYSKIKKDDILTSKTIKSIKKVNYPTYYSITFNLMNKSIYTELTNKQITRMLLKNYIFTTEESHQIKKKTPREQVNLLINTKEKLYRLSIPKYSKLDFSAKVNYLYQSINHLKEQNKKIAIYGNGLIGKIIAKELQEQVTIVFDQNKESISEYAPTDTPNNINKYNFDFLIIAVLGRELEIIELIKKNAPKSKFKIIELPLVKS